ncbi:MAG: electron transfer flavoprotein-ubiquinone oxidoreductase [Magnetospirillum sp. WYHS-4]
MPRDKMEFDVVIVGAGPAGLAAAIRLRQVAVAAGRDLSVCLVEKGAQVGAHVLSGNVFDPRALDELLPDWRERNAPLATPARRDRFLLLGRKRALPLPVPANLGNRGCYVISLGRLCHWLGERAEELGVEIYPGFAATELLEEGGRIVGIATGDMGLAKDGSPGPAFAPGMELRARLTLLAEGCRGSLSQQAIRRFRLDAGRDSQTYGLGIKELWEVAPDRHRPGLVLHTAGWPLDSRCYGGGFLYHLEDRRVAVGLVVGLDYTNPHLDPFAEMQRLKTHPALRSTFEDGRRLAYGARALVEGGPQALPRLVFPGGALIGDAAGFLDVARIKGAHTAMKSGMLAAEAALAALDSADADVEMSASYPETLKRSWVWEQLWRSRNVRPAFRWGLWAGLANAALGAMLFKGEEPWTLHHRGADHQALRHATDCPPIAYPKPDGTLTFDRASSVYLSGTNHREGQPCHLVLGDAARTTEVNFPLYAGPEARYCPAGVYEYVTEGGWPKLRINAQNCLHCKTCDIKDPTGNILWVPPEGGGGPLYTDM